MVIISSNSCPSKMPPSSIDSASCAMDGQNRTSPIYNKNKTTNKNRCFQSLRWWNVKKWNEFVPVGEIDRHDAICWPSVVKTVINDALCPISQWGNVNSRHWLIIGLRCARMLLSYFGVESLYCHINNFRPWIAHAQPLPEQYSDTFTFRSLRLSASFTVIGNCSPKFWATLFAERAMIWFDWIDRPETLNRLSTILILGYVLYAIYYLSTLKWFLDLKYCLPWCGTWLFHTTMDGFATGHYATGRRFSHWWRKSRTRTTFKWMIHFESSHVFQCKLQYL